MLKLEIPPEKNKLESKIKSLKYLIENDTNEKDKRVHTGALKVLRENLLYDQYLKLQSNEWKEDIKGYESFKESGHDLAIKVIFTWGWLRVYRTTDTGIEWY